MVFSSLLFVFLFLSLNLMIYYAVKQRYRNAVLLTFSLIFYAWGGPKYIVLLLCDVLISYLSALGVEKSKAHGKSGKLALVLGIALLLLVLGLFKYTGFFLDNFKLLFGVPDLVPTIVLPIGISFYTFQLISYVVDVYRGDTPAQKNYGKLLLYASLFHQCIAGPIVRYTTVAEEIDHRYVSDADVAYGIRRFCIGLAKKAILANTCGTIADTLLPSTVTAVSASSTVGLWIGMLAYMMQIYLDFSAYSDMAIGMGRMVGFHYLENFNYPYIAKTVQDFWRRWHISLSTFFRDYVYIPLGGSRVSSLRWLFNILVVWFLTGMWHGASWNFIFWGLYFGLFLIFEKFVLSKIKLPAVLSHVYALLVVFFGWVLFRFDDLSLMGAVVSGLFGSGTAGALTLQTQTFVQNYCFFLPAAVLACTPLGAWIRTKLLAGQTGARRLMQVIDVITPVALLVISAMALAGNSYNPFMYFRF